jgi:phosphatidylglycerophosphatase C
VNARTVRVAAFDVDGTLTTSDCVVAFLRRISGTVPLSLKIARSPLTSGGALLRRDRDALKAAAVRAAFTGRPVGPVEHEARRFAEEVAATRLRRDTLAALDEHRRRGDTTVFVSASFELYLQPLAGLLGVDAVIGTRLNAPGGVFDGTLQGPNCRGAEKVRRLHALLVERWGSRDAVDVVAYGDSAGDRELLADADEAHWMGTYRP